MSPLLQAPTQGDTVLPEPWVKMQMVLKNKEKFCVGKAWQHFKDIWELQHLRGMFSFIRTGAVQSFCHYHSSCYSPVLCTSGGKKSRYKSKEEIQHQYDTCYLSPNVLSILRQRRQMRRADTTSVLQLLPTYTPMFCPPEEKKSRQDSNGLPGAVGYQSTISGIQRIIMNKVHHYALVLHVCFKSKLFILQQILN